MCTSMGDPKIHGNLQRILDNPSTLKEHTPKEWKRLMEKEGRIAKPLGNGAFKGVDLEDGGGFKVNFEDGGLFMYHPEERSHHKIAYYKLSRGKKGVKRYDREGNELKDL